MIGENLLALIEKGLSGDGLIAAIYGDLAKPGVQQVGKALSTVLGLGNTVLLPLHLLNEKSRIAVEKNLENYRQKLENIPIEKVVPVAPELGVPIIEKLAFTSDNDLRELFTNLLTKASSSDTVSLAHPGFVSVIGSLSPDEAKVLAWIKKNPVLPFVAVSVGSEEKDTWAKVEDFQFGAELAATVRFKENFAAYASNLQGLGLIEVSRTRQMPNDGAYQDIETGLENRFSGFGSLPGMKEIRFERGIVGFTLYGWLFCNACVS